MFDVPWGYWVWAGDSRSIYMGQIQGNNEIFRLTVPGGDWKRLGGIEGMNDPQAADSFLSQTPDDSRRGPDLFTAAMQA